MLRLTISTFICLSAMQAQALPSKTPCNSCIDFILNGKIPSSDVRYRTFRYAFTLLSQKNSPTIVETGTARQGSKWCVGDGCSTLLFGQWVENNGGTFYSVDISEQALNNAKNALENTADFVHLVHSDSIEFLKNFPDPIDFLYLDSFDFEINNPLPSQEHHLKEIIAAYPKLHQNSIVMIDDCDLPHGGKGKLVINYLLEKGWKVRMNGYQVVLSL